MRSPLLSLVVLVNLSGCGSVVTPGAVPDAPPDAGAEPLDGPPAVARCDPQAPFGIPSLTPSVNTADDEIGFALTRDELTAFVDHYVQAPSPGSRLIAARRSAPTAPFATPGDAATRKINDVAGDELWPSPASDGLTLYFTRAIAGARDRVFATARPDLGAAFSSDLAVTIDRMDLDGDQPVISSDGQALYWIDDFTQLLQTGTRGERDTVFVAARDVSVMPLANPVLSADELTLYYSNGAGTDILTSTRSSKAASFNDGVPVAVINTGFSDAPAFLTPDSCILYLKSNRPGGVGGIDIWEAHRAR